MCPQSGHSRDGSDELVNSPARHRDDVDLPAKSNANMQEHATTVRVSQVNSQCNWTNRMGQVCRLVYLVAGMRSIQGYLVPHITIPLRTEVHVHNELGMVPYNRGNPTLHRNSQQRPSALRGLDLPVLRKVYHRVPQAAIGSQPPGHTFRNLRQGRTSMSV